MSLIRRDEVVLNHRLRMGHTHYTHVHLMKKETTAICQTCGYPTREKFAGS